VTHKTSNEPLLAGLYIVATPIGNLADITFRAADVLARCDGIACEDTRITGKLLKHLDISKPLWRYDDHSKPQERARLIEMMQSRAVALVSDAGTPLISDPGYRLVRDARDAGVKVTSLPGACAAITALTLSGLPNDRFLFSGFLPNKEKARLDMLATAGQTDATLIFYDTGPRLVKSLAAIDAALPGREVSVARELTKLYEECRTGAPAQLIQHYTAHPAKGEIVLLVAPPPLAVPVIEDVDETLRGLLKTMKVSQAAAQLAKDTGLDRKILYARAMQIRET